MTDFFSLPWENPEPDVRPAGPTCPIHHIELPSSGVCDDC